MRVFILFLVSCFSFYVYAQNDNLGLAVSKYDDVRYCGEVYRNASGDIIRSSTVLTAFKKIHPCPSTGLVYGECPGWAIDHVVPLACGGCDAVFNLQWLPNAAKSCSEDYCKDRFERKIYSLPNPLPGQSSYCSPGFPIK